MSDDRSAPDLRSLEDRYVIRGELRGTESARYYIGSTRDGADEVAITLVRAPKGGGNNALSHLAADAQILSDASQPLLARVLEGRWIGGDAFALVAERVPGETLDQLIERGERFSNARIAMLLQQVAGALDWAREHGVVHRGITPDTMLFERDTNRLRLTFTPTPIPMSGVPDVATDGRTIATLAWTMMTGERYAEGETPRSLGEVCPNLATRVIESTDKMLHAKDHVDTPDIPAYLAVIAAGDVMKQAEVELAAMKEEYDEQHRQEIQKCELHRQETEQHAAEQLALLAGEREELERQISDERAAIAAERTQFEQLMEERKERLAAVRAELDEQRVELERRLAELETYRTDVEKLRDDAISAREEAKAAREEAKAAAANAAREEAKAAAANAAREEAKDGVAAVAAIAAVTTAAPSAGTTPGSANATPQPAAVPVVERVIDKPHERPAKLPKPPKAPKWQKMEPVDLDATDVDTVTVGNGRPAWMIPAGVATLALIVIAVVFSITHRASSADRVKIGKSTVVPTAPVAPNGIVPRGGFLTQSAGGNVASPMRSSPLVDSATGANAAAAAAASGAPMNADPANIAAPANDLMNPAPSTTARPTSTEQSLAESAAAAARRAARRTTSDITTGTTEPATTNSAPTNAGTTAPSAFTPLPTTTAPIVTPAPVVAAPQPIRTPVPDPAAQAAARAAQARADSEAARRRQQAITDSLNSPASSWNKVPPSRPDTTHHRTRR
jgi:hypothetical protein